MERAAVRLPLPASLRRELRSIPAAAAGLDAPRFLLPRRPLPAPLHSRLRSLAGTGAPARTPLPGWLRSPRYAVAASYLVAVLTIHVLGDPLALGRRAMDSAAQRWSRLWTEAAAVERFLRGFESHVTVTYGETRDSLAASLATLGSRVSAVRELIPETMRRP